MNIKIFGLSGRQLVIYDLLDLFYGISNTEDPGKREGRLLVQMIADDKVKIEATSDLAAAAFTQAAKIYTR